MAQIGNHDVLLGRGGATNNNPGNVLFRQVVASKQLVYLNAKKKEKKSIAEECVKTVKADGGRFLRRDNDSGCWVEVPNAAAVKKASQALREGLDVRHKCRREGKSGLIIACEPDRQKRQKVVSGKVNVTSSPALVSVSGEEKENGVPELKDEMPAPASAAVAAPTSYQPAPAISSKQCDEVVYV